MNKKEKSEWVKSPITNKDHVIQEYDDAGGVSKMCIGSGFFTNEYPLNYKKHNDFPIEKYEEGMPQIMKDVRFDDGESYWYPTTIQTEKGMVYPEPIKGTKDWGWTVVKAVPIPEDEQHKYPDPRNPGQNYKNRMDMKNLKRFDKMCFMDAAEELGMFSKEALEVKNED